MNCEITCSKLCRCKINSQIGPRRGFFQWVDNHTCKRGNETAHLSFKESICLRMNFSLQLRVKGQLGKLKKKLLREKEKLMNCM